MHRESGTKPRKVGPPCVPRFVDHPSADGVELSKVIRVLWQILVKNRRRT